jgi:hypothetical protein
MSTGNDVIGLGNYTIEDGILPRKDLYFAENWTPEGEANIVRINLDNASNYSFRIINLRQLLMIMGFINFCYPRYNLSGNSYFRNSYECRMQYSNRNEPKKPSNHGRSVIIIIKTHYPSGFLLNSALFSICNPCRIPYPSRNPA